MSSYSYETLQVSGPVEGVLEVALNRPKRLNAMNDMFWKEIGLCMDQADLDNAVRVVIITGGESRIFTAGLDLQEAMQSGSTSKGSTSDVGRRSMKILPHILLPQTGISAIEKCKKPVIVAMHSAVIGGGIDLACAGDIRYCSADAYFSIAEVKVGLAADVGTLQRLPKIVGNDSIVRELAYTGRRMESKEAKELGLVGRILPTKEECWAEARRVAKEIAQNSPIAVSGTKISLNYSRDHTIQEGLDHIRIWNMAMLQTEDMTKAAMAQLSKQKPEFSNL